MGVSQIEDIVIARSMITASNLVGFFVFDRLPQDVPRPYADIHNSEWAAAMAQVEELSKNAFAKDLGLSPLRVGDSGQVALALDILRDGEADDLIDGDDESRMI